MFMKLTPGGDSKVGADLFRESSCLGRKLLLAYPQPGEPNDDIPRSDSGNFAWNGQT